MFWYYSLKKSYKRLKWVTSISQKYLCDHLLTGMHSSVIKKKKKIFMSRLIHLRNQSHFLIIANSRKIESYDNDSFLFQYALFYKLCELEIKQNIFYGHYYSFSKFSCYFQRIKYLTQVLIGIQYGRIFIEIIYGLK